MPSAEGVYGIINMYDTLDPTIVEAVLVLPAQMFSSLSFWAAM